MGLNDYLNKYNLYYFKASHSRITTKSMANNMNLFYIYRGTQATNMECARYMPAYDCGAFNSLNFLLLLRNQ